MNKEQLKPCPFCGSGNVGNGHTAVWWVSCYSCSADGPTADTELEAAEQWNHAPRTSDVAALHSTANLLETVFAETAQELGCKQDNEAVLEAIAALRARAVPVIVWNVEKATCGSFLLGASEHEWLIGLALNGQLYMLFEGKTGGKPACEAALLRLVGAGS
jgi:Lar family restriction alleviation protein